MNRLHEAFDADGRANPGKVLPAASYQEPD